MQEPGHILRVSVSVLRGHEIYMHVAGGPPARDHGGVQPDALGPFEITDADVESSKPRVRALIVGRLEALQKPVNQHLALVEEGVDRADPRILELGLRLAKELALQYRLGRMPTVTEDDTEDPGAGVDRAAVIEARLKELEAKHKGQAAGA